MKIYERFVITFLKNCDIINCGIISRMEIDKMLSVKKQKLMWVPEILLEMNLCEDDFWTWYFGNSNVSKHVRWSNV